jgi:membrane protein YqaA with SNARE-associated domain
MSNELEKLLFSNDPITPQEISDFDHMRRMQRESLYLIERPLSTISNFLSGVIYFFQYCIRLGFHHFHALTGLFIFLLIWKILLEIPGPHSEMINLIQFSIEYVVWWVGLGILSSVGLGSGLQSGVLFLFPHIVKVSFAAHSCNSLDFSSSADMWFNSSRNLFECPSLTSSATPVSFFGIWKKIILACFLQSTGTAIGEIPPYWMTKSAREAALRAKYDIGENLPEELETNSDFFLVNKGKQFLIWLLQEYGFYGVLLMASYPNIAFDLCGICCGHFLMPFWTFFIATFLGKAIIRNSYQSIFYVMLCR